MRCRVVLILVLMLGGLNAHAQNLGLIDSLRRQLRGATADQQFQLWNAIGFEFRYSYPDSTIFYCTMAYEQGKAREIETELSKPLSFIGLAYANKGDYKNSLQYHYESIEVATAQNDSVQLAFGYNNLGRMFFDQGDLVRAYDNFIRAKDIFEVLNEKSGLAYVYRSLANIHSSQKEFSKALEMSEYALTLRKGLGDPRLLISSFMELGIIQQAAGKTDDALRSFLSADSIADRVNDPTTQAELTIGLAEILSAEGKWPEAMAELKTISGNIHEATNQKLFLRASYLQAQYYYHQKDLGRAASLLREVFQSAERSGNVSFQRDAAFLLAEIYKQQRSAGLMEEYQNRYRIFSEMLQNTDFNRQIDRLQFQLEMEKKEKENEQLKANEARNLVLLKQKRFENLLLIIIIVSIAVIAMLVFWVSRRRRHINLKLEQQNSHILRQREEITKQNESLSHSNRVLSDLNQEKNTIMNIVAHDLKSPLNRIKGLSNLMEMEGGLNANQQGYLKLIKESTQSGIDLIIDLLDVNALEEISGAAHYEEVSIGPLLNERAQALQVAAQEKLIDLKVELQFAGPVKTDRSYVSRIADNLLTNAIKFSPKGSTVWLKSAKDAGMWSLSVRDQGPGFSEDDRKFLFQKFKRLSARPTAGESSNGLGLAIVKTLVDRLKGKIELKSEQGKGSEFVVRLPLEV